MIKTVMRRAPTSPAFSKLVREIPEIGIRKHQQAILAAAKTNLSLIGKSIRDLSRDVEKNDTCLVVSAGPSLRRNHALSQIAWSKFKGKIISVDGSYVACLKASIIPDYMMTLDPHPTRIVRWFGDLEFEKNSSQDDYFTRQDLDLEFRKNSIEQNLENIQLVNQKGFLTKGIVASSSPSNVVNRLRDAKFDLYWFNPLMDDPSRPGLTHTLYSENRLPCLNTGGTVSTAVIIFAATILGFKRIGVVGLDFGYYSDTPLEKTQTYYELLAHCRNKAKINEYFIEFIFPLTGQKFFTDPTYYWYRQNFFELLPLLQGVEVVNCSEAGTVFGKGIQCSSLNDFLKNS